jgi:hypothetical protein
LSPFPPPLPNSTSSSIPLSTQKISAANKKNKKSSNLLQHRNSLVMPLLDSRCRARMLILTLCGVLGNFTGEKARSMIWQILIDNVHGQSAGYSYNLWESGFFFGNFWVGAVLSLVWLTMLFLFGMSLFLETANGKDRVENWIPFNLEFGFSYFGWTFLILFISGFPGFLVWQGVSFFLPEKESQLMILHFICQFLCFPIFFLCVIESDTFLGNFPRKTFTSLGTQFLLWLRFYVTSIILAIVPVTIFCGLIVAGTALDEYGIMHSLLYYLVAAILLTFSGYFVLLYFRLLGNIARKIQISVH